MGHRSLCLGVGGERFISSNPLDILGKKYRDWQRKIPMSGSGLGLKISRRLGLGSGSRPSVYVIFYHIASLIRAASAAKQKLEYSCDRLEYSVHDKRIQ